MEFTDENDLSTFHIDDAYKCLNPRGRPPSSELDWDLLRARSKSVNIRTKKYPVISFERGGAVEQLGQ